MKNFSIKSKLITVVASFLIILVTIIAVVAIVDLKSSLEDSEIEKLSAIEIAKSDEIKNYLNDLKALLISLSEAKGTRDALVEFENSFYKLDEETNINLDNIKNELQNDIRNNFINKVNYEVPDSSSKKDVASYIPNNINAQIAQYIFITKNKFPEKKDKLIYNPEYKSSYMNTHKTYHQLFDNYLTSFHLYDIFIADLKGNLVYSTFKERDFATNLKKGIYKDSGLAKVYEKALNISDSSIAFEDFSPYEPSYNNSSSFISSPIFVNGEKKGVLIFQVPTSSLSNIVNFNNKHKEAGLGESGECYLVGPDYKMRTNSRFMENIDNKLVQELKSTVGILEIKSESTKAIFEKGKDRGEGILNNYKGTLVLSTYKKVDLFDGLGSWAIIAEMNRDEALETASALTLQIILISLACIIIAILLSWIIINKVIINPLDNFKNGLLNFFKYLNKESNSVEPLSINSSDEIGQMSSVINDNIFKTQKTIESDNKFIDEVSAMIKTINKGLLDKRFENKVESENLEKLRLNMNLMLENLNSIIGNDTNKVLEVLKCFAKLDFTNYIENDNAQIPTALNNVTNLITQMLVENKTTGITLNQSASDLLSNMQTLSTSSNEAAASLEQTAAAIEEVASNISNSTENVVSMARYAKELNTSSTSGQELAKKTTVSMDEINTEVKSINEAITIIDQIAFQTNILSLNAAVEAATAGESGKGFAVVAQEVRNLANRSAEAAKEIKDLVESATSKANDGKEIADKMIEGYTDLTNNISSTMDLIHGVEDSAKEQKSVIEQINSAINQLDQQTQKNAQISSETTNIAKETQEIAQTILNDVNKKEFEGKENIKSKNSEFQNARNTEIKKEEINLEKIEKAINSKQVITPKREIVSNTKDDDAWESF